MCLAKTLNLHNAHEAVSAKYIANLFLLHAIHDFELLVTTTICKSWLSGKGNHHIITR